MDRNLALEFVRVTEAGAIAAAKWIGKGDKKAADGAAVDAMRERFNSIEFAGTVVIGEGEKDEAPELYVGEKIGTGNGPAMDIAVDPLECTSSVAYGRPNAMSVVAAGISGSLFQAPDMYMKKIACGPAARGRIDLDAATGDNIRAVAEASGKSPDEITVVVLDRPRHEALIQEIRAAGARVQLITDGTVAGAVATCFPGSGTDLLMSVAGSTEAVLAAAAIKALGGDIQGRLQPKDRGQEERLKKLGVDFTKKLTRDDLASGQDIAFTATGIIDGPLLKGVRYENGYCITHSVAMRVKSGTVRFLETRHLLKG